MTDPSNQHLLNAIEELTEKMAALGELEAMSARMGSLERRTITIENARAAARSDYDANWTDVKDRLGRIEVQTLITNGRVTKLEELVLTLNKIVDELRQWKAYMSGVASSFSWWKPAVATIAAAAVMYAVTR